MVLANVMAPYVAWGVGDDMALSLPWSMLATLLAGVIERPFVRWAGCGRKTLLFALRANILSWAVGAGIVYFSLFASNFRSAEILYVMIILAIPFSVAIEGTYLAPESKMCGSRLRWLPIVLGNIISGSILAGIASFGLRAGDKLQTARSPLVSFLQDHTGYLYGTVLCACIVCFLAILLVPARPCKPRQQKPQIA
jgi:hypothetical protein